MRKSLFILLIFLYCSDNTFAQYKNVMISNLNTPEEVGISIDPKNPDHIVAASNIDNYYYSTDGGYTWSWGQINSSFGVWGDPVVVVDTNSAFYYFHLSNAGAIGGSWVDRMVCQKVNFIGGSWSDGTTTGKNGTKVQDKPGVAMDRKNNNIYITWTQFDTYGSTALTDSSIILFSRSIDGGNTWSNPTRINNLAGDCRDNDSTVEGAIPAVGPNGEVYVSWAGPLGIVFNRSFDLGKTWMSSNTFVTSIPGGWDYNIPGIYRCNGLPYTNCDVSNGPHRGTIYISWSDQRNGIDNTDVWIVKSTDSGNTWSAPVKVNDDATRSQQFMSSMTIDQANGDIYVLFYDRRNYTDDNTDVYLARSSDGGNTFKNFRISTSPFYPTTGAFFGDYTAITAHNGFVRPMWTRLDTAHLSVWTAIIDSSLSADNMQLNNNSSFSAYPNPFSPTAYMSYELDDKEQVSLFVADIFGRTVAIIRNNEILPRGKYVDRFDANQFGLPPGIYCFYLHAGDHTQVQKMVLK